MSPRPSVQPGWARRLSGAATFFVAAFFLSGCDGRPGTDDWSSSRQADAPRAASGLPAPPPAASNPRPASAQGEGEGLRFMAYNLRNWLHMERQGAAAAGQATLPKPADEREALIRIVARHRPDVLGVCEIGGPADLEDLRAALLAAGLDLPHVHHHAGDDPVRQLGLLSRHPITATARPRETSFRIAGSRFEMNRGILDATVTSNGGEYRFMGVHLKSKREVAYVDQELMRLQEAELLRLHVDQVLSAEPEARLVVYGDFNDSRLSPAVRKITGGQQTPGHLHAIPLRDSRGHAWTYRWQAHDIYSRIDFVTVSRPLRGEIDLSASLVADDEGWDLASDHRALLVVFR